MTTARQVEKAKGGGNCAFNAFILALSQESVLNKIKEPTDDVFIREVAAKLHVAQTWEAIKKELSDTRKILDDEKRRQALENIQMALNGIFRAKAISLMRDQSIHGDIAGNYQQVLFAAFEEYKKGGNPSDDILLKRDSEGLLYVHQKIIDKFDELISQSLDDESTQIILDAWWDEDTGGRKIFLDKMAGDGVWAGHFELMSLADYFEVKLYEVQSPEQERPVFLNDNSTLTDTSPSITLKHDGAHWDNVVEKAPPALSDADKLRVLAEIVTQLALMCQLLQQAMVQLNMILETAQKSGITLFGPAPTSSITTTPAPVPSVGGSKPTKS